MKAVYVDDIIKYVKTAYEKAKAASTHSETESYAFTLRTLRAVTDAMTPLEVVTVVHGRWRAETEEEQPHIAIRQVVCSICNGKAHGRYDYCPNCGAKMDLE